MKIIIEGTKKEIELAKETIKGVCMFDGEFCSLFDSCNECEKKQGLVKEFIIK